MNSITILEDTNNEQLFEIHSNKKISETNTNRKFVKKNTSSITNSELSNSPNLMHCKSKTLKQENKNFWPPWNSINSKTSIWRSNSSTFRTETESEMSKQDIAMRRLWYKSSYQKKITVPNQFPYYLKKQPNLKFEETHSFIKRKNFNQNKIKITEESSNSRKEGKETDHIQPKMNRAAILRYTCSKKKPIVSKYFESHFKHYQRPLFKTTV